MKIAEFLSKSNTEENVFLLLRRCQKCRVFAEDAEIAQLVEHNLAKVGVAGPSPVFRSLIEQKRGIKEWL